MKCKGKFDPVKNNIFDYDIKNDNMIRIYRDDFEVNITQNMFDELYEDVTIKN